MLAHVQNKDTGEIGDTLNELMMRLNETDPNDLVAQDSNIFRKIFGRVKKSIYEMQSKYQEVGSQVDKIAVRLDHEKNGLLNDNLSLEQLYQRNKEFFEGIKYLYRCWGIEDWRVATKLIPEAMQKAQDRRPNGCTNQVNDLHQFLDRLEKRNHDLKLTRQMTIQQAPQIRLIQNTEPNIGRKIQSSITTTIPLWKNQIAIAMTLLRQKDAVTAATSSVWNDKSTDSKELWNVEDFYDWKQLVKNERGIIDLETLQKTQQELIETLEETILIQQEGRQKRRKAEYELTQMEQELRENLLVLSQKKTMWRKKCAVNPMTRNLYLLFLNKDWRVKIFCSS